MIIPDASLAYLHEKGHTDQSLAAYEARVATDIECMSQWVGNANAIWDIGCGIGLHAARIADIVDAELIYLTDGAPGAETGRKVGYKDDTQGSFDVRHSAAIALSNCDETRFVGQCFDEPPLMVDLVYSLKSWCHHYPAGHYLDAVMHSLHVGGRLIVDCRKGTDNRDVLAASGFHELAVIADRPKRWRIAFEFRGQ